VCRLLTVTTGALGITMDELLYIIIGHNKLQLRDWSDTIMIRLRRAAICGHKLCEL